VVVVVVGGEERMRESGPHSAFLIYKRERVTHVMAHNQQTEMQHSHLAPYIIKGRHP